MPDPRPGTAACGCRVFRNDGAGWYCDTHGNPPESMADVMADAARHTDRFLAHANRMVEMYKQRGFEQVPGTCRLFIDLADLVRHWRGAYHETISRLDRHADTDQDGHGMSDRPDTARLACDLPAGTVTLDLAPEQIAIGQHRYWTRWTDSNGHVTTIGHPSITDAATYIGHITDHTGGAS